MSTVSDIFDAIGHRMPEKSNRYPALNNVVRLIAKRLFWHKSDLCVASLSVAVTASSEYASMPTDFWGLMQKPYINGKTWSLEPLPTKENALTMLSADGEPRYFRMKGAAGVWRMYLYPNNSSAITINGDYFSRPTQLTKLSDTIPFNEMFDEVIQEGMVLFYTQGGTALANIISEAVDNIVPLMDKTTVTQFPYPSELEFNTLTNTD